MVRGDEELGQRGVNAHSPAEREEVVHIRYKNDRFRYGSHGTHHGLEERVAGLLSPPLCNADKTLPASAALWPLVGGDASIVVGFFDKQHDQYEAHGGFNGVNNKRPVPG